MGSPAIIMLRQWTLKQAQHMGVLERQRLVRHASLEDVSLLVVDDKNIAERPVNHVKAKVGANLVQLTVVLNQRIQEHVHAA